MFRSFPLGAVVIVFVWRSESILLYPNNSLFQVIFSLDFNPFLLFTRCLLYSPIYSIGFSRFKIFSYSNSVFRVIEIRFRNLISEANQPNSNSISVEKFFPNEIVIVKIILIFCFSDFSGISLRNLQKVEIFCIYIYIYTFFKKVHSTTFRVEIHFATSLVFVAPLCGSCGYFLLSPFFRGKQT